MQQAVYTWLYLADLVTEVAGFLKSEIRIQLWLGAYRVKSKQLNNIVYGIPNEGKPEPENRSETKPSGASLFKGEDFLIEEELTWF